MFQCNQNIYLEPRLQEYITKKKYYKKNNIKPDVSLEKEYNITKGDVRLMGAFLKGDRDMYEDKRQEEYYGDETREIAQQFETDPDEMFKSDPRFKNYQTKMSRDKKAMKQRHEYNNLEQDYENAFGPITANVANERDNEEYLNIKQSQPFTAGGRDFGYNSRYKYTDGEYTSPRMYGNAVPEIQYKDHIQYKQNNVPVRPPIDHNPELANVLDKLDTYGQNLNGTYQNYSKFDTDLKVPAPKMKTNRPVPYMGMGGSVRQQKDGRAITCRYPQYNSKAKSNGFSNPSEHYFDYISNDISDPDHTCTNRSISTRLDNQTTAKSYRRDII